MENLMNKLDIKIEPKSARPVYEQIKQGIQVAILSGYLKKGDRLLPIRTLAKNLKVNPNTIVKVYYQLDVEGFIYSKAGLGYFVNCECKDKRAKETEVFRKITEEYISRSSKLGFSVEDMFEEIKKFNDKLVGKKSRGEKK